MRGETEKVYHKLEEALNLDIIIDLNPLKKS